VKKPKKKATKVAVFFSSLIRNAYFPVELPPAITTKYFADYCRSDYAFLKTQQAGLITKTTNYETFTAPRGATGRRNLALVHPLTQAGLSLLITQQRAKIRKHVGTSRTTLYRLDENLQASKAFEGLDFRRWDILKAKIYSEYPFVLQADISRFFYTMYTHSIPWAVIGKAKVKDWLASKNKKKLDKHWSNNFDVAMQSCRSRETFGIPVGPDTSRLIAELLLAGVEQDADLAPFLKLEKSIRLVDDFTIGFEDIATAQKCLGALRTALWKFNLQLNEEKTSILPTRAIYRPKWEIEQELLRISDSRPRLQERDIYRFIDATLHFCSETKSDTPAIWAARRLSELRNVELNFSVIMEALFRLSHDFPRSMSHVSSFLINNQHLCTDGHRTKVTAWTKAVLKRNLDHNHDFEIAWCLVVCAVLKIEIDDTGIPKSKIMPNATIFALLGLLHEKGLLKVSLSTWPWRAHLKKYGVHSEMWLPYYESVRRGWTKDKKLISAINSDPVFSKMLAAKVTFLEDLIFDAAKINLARRVFIKAEASPLKNEDGNNLSNPKFPMPKKRQKVTRGFGDLTFEAGDLDY